MKIGAIGFELRFLLSSIIVEDFYQKNLISVRESMLTVQTERAHLM